MFRKFTIPALAICAVLWGIPAFAADDSKDQIADLKKQIVALEKRIEQLESASKPSTEAPAPPAESSAGEANGAPPPPAEASTTAEQQSTPSGGRTLLLPDISVIGTFASHVTNDKRDTTADRITLEDLELGIQGYVYPGIKADMFIVHPRENDHTASVEEAYLTALNLGHNLSLRVGKTKASFGRVNMLHPHSWLYITQPAALKNLVASESLAGEGVSLSYLFPTKSKSFVQLDLGMWNNPEQPVMADISDLTSYPEGSGAGFKDRFGTARLWSSIASGDNSELELGVSHAWGSGAFPAVTPIAPNTAAIDPSSSVSNVNLTGLDLSYRRFEGNSKRFLARGEYLWHNNDFSGAPAGYSSNATSGTSKGYYLLLDQRVNSYREYGLRYDWSEYPYFQSQHESGLSAIVTNQLTEQTYLRLQLTHGSRPGRDNLNEAFLQWVWGIGPHTHNLE